MTRKPIATTAALLLCALAALQVPAAPRKPSPAADLARLLPTAAQTRVWTPKAPPRLMSGEEIFDYMDGAGEIPIACGYRALGVVEYAGKAGGVITLELYDMGSSANAFGLYSMKRTPGGRYVALDHRAHVGYNDLLAWKGRYTLVVFSDDAKKVHDTDLLVLGKLALAHITEKGTPPDLLRFLPREGYTPNTARYFHGKGALDTVRFVRQDVFGLKSRPDVATAAYASPAGKVLVIRYPTPTAAALALSSANRAAETKGTVFVLQGRLLAAAWSGAGKPPAPALVDRLKRSLAKPGPAWAED